jgi:hypothetical protein
MDVSLAHRAPATAIGSAALGTVVALNVFVLARTSARGDRSTTS